MRIEKGFVHGLVRGIPVFICIMAGVLGSPSVSQAAYSILHSFSGGSDGGSPYGDLTLSGSTLYGMTSGLWNDQGTIFQINTDGAGYQVLHSFSWNDGANPRGSLTLSGTTLYGMTSGGGANGLGAISQINTDGAGFQLLHSFGAGSDGASPFGSLTLSGSTLYGMTALGGADGAGTIFKINTDGAGYQVLYSFNGGSEGGSPYGDLTLSGSTLYGMTSPGGGNAGTIFKINTDGTGFQVLHSFNWNDGAIPDGALTLSMSGSALYGMTSSGGANGFGTIFQINTYGAGFQVLYNFAGESDGGAPHGSLTLSGSTLYGMAHSSAGAYGTIFSFSLTPGAAPGAPAGVTAKAGNAQATVSFTPPASNGGSAITGYTVTSNPAGGVDSNAGTASTTHTVTGLTNGTAYTFTVTATNGIGTGPPSLSSNSVTPTAPGKVPGAPAGVTAKAGNAQATVSFKLPSNGGSPITVCTVTSHPGNVTATGSGSPITVQNLTNGTAYTFTVTATNGVGTGPASSHSNSVTPATVPGAPAIGTVTPGNTQATVYFTAPASNSGSAITGYTVTSSSGQTGKGAKSPITVKGLTNGDSYSFTVTATNRIGTSPPSGSSNSVTPTK